MSERPAGREAAEDMQGLQHRMERADLETGVLKDSEVLEAEKDFQRSGYGEARDLANELIGRIRLAQGFSKLATVSGLRDLAHIKENKLYQVLAGKKVESAGGERLATVATWEGFCQALGMSRRKVDEDLQNLAAFGEDALNAMNRIGLGYRDLRRLRKLPDDAREVIINGEAVKVGDKEEIVSLIEELGAGYAQEKEAMERENAALSDTLEARDKLLAEEKAKTTRLKADLHRRETRTKSWPDRTFEISQETTNVACKILEGCDQLDTLRDTILNEDFSEDDRAAAIESMAVVYFDAVRQVFEKANDLAHFCQEAFEGYKDRARPLVQMSDLYGPRATGQEPQP